MSMNITRVSLFSRFARWASTVTGRPAAFIIAVSVIITWAITGPYFGFSNTWQLVINSGTTIVTVLMVFLIQNTQNRDTEALQIKLDELIRSSRFARNDLLNLEEMDEAELDTIRQEYLDLAEHAQRHLTKRKNHSSK